MLLFPSQDVTEMNALQVHNYTLSLAMSRCLALHDLLIILLLQRAVGNDTVYTAAAYRKLCKMLSIPWRSSSSASTPYAGASDGLVDSGRFVDSSKAAVSGISPDGLLSLYRHMGLECLVRDMRTLGIPPDKARQQLESLRRTVRHLTTLEAKVKVSQNHSVHCTS